MQTLFDRICSMIVFSYMFILPFYKQIQKVSSHFECSFKLSWCYRSSKTFSQPSSFSSIHRKCYLISPFVVLHTIELLRRALKPHENILKSWHESTKPFPQCLDTLQLSWINIQQKIGREWKFSSVFILSDTIFHYNFLFFISPAFAFALSLFTHSQDGKGNKFI